MLVNWSSNGFHLYVVHNINIGVKMIVICNILKTFFSRLLKVVWCVCVCVCVSAPVLYPGRERTVDVAL